MKTSDFAYDLPEELIAQDPLSDRASSRLMILDKQTGEITHRIFHDITEYLKPGDCLVLNDTKVIPARLIGEREETGGKVEVLLLKRGEDNVWETLVKPGKKARPGTRLVFGGGLLRAEVVDIVEEGNRLIRFEYEGIFEEILDQLGQMPLPPYITHKLEDKNRYQTVYAKYEGSAAAPTAGLHFTTELLQQIEQMGVSIARVTLHVGMQVENGDKKVIKTFDFPVQEGICREETSEKMRFLLEKVVSEGGGNKAYIEGYEIGGKTATSQTLPRSAHKYISSFLGFAPADDPKVLVLVIIRNPSGIYYGGTIAAPVAKEIFENILPYLELEQ